MMEKLTRLSFFLIGFVMAFDLSGVYGKIMLSKKKHTQIKSDFENIACDWENVGNSFHGALNKYELQK